MSNKKKRKPKKRRGIQHRIRKWKTRDGEDVERLIQLATEAVVPGTGERTFGRGPYCYVKGCYADPESVRIFRFRKQADARRASEAAITADAIAEGREDELEAILNQFHGGD